MKRVTEMTSKGEPVMAKGTSYGQPDANGATFPLPPQPQPMKKVDSTTAFYDQNTRP
jgi:hypothetical protein